MSTDMTVWTSQGRQLMLSVNSGSARPFLVKGAAYSPTPVGQTSTPDPLGEENSAIWQRDLPLLRAMGTNAIRIYGMDATNRKNCTPFLDAAWNGGADPIYVILSIWLNPAENGIDNVNEMAKQYSWIAQDYGKHAAVMSFSVGSEYNTPQNIVTGEFWKDFNTIASAVEANTTQKVISTGFVDLVTNNEETTIVEGEAQNAVVDVWGIDSYRGDTFTNLWQQIESATKKPFLITEFGAPASYHPNNVSCEAAELPSTGKPNMQDLVNYMQSLWKEIEANWAKNSGKVGSGGFVFEWTDEWWKSPQCGRPDEHKGGTAQNGAFPGGWDDEEWFGLNSISSGTPNTLTQRATYNLFKGLWTS